MLRNLAFILLTVGLLACGTVQRKHGSGYSGGSFDSDDVAMDQDSSRALSPEERDKLEDQVSLNKLEHNLRTSEERAQYSRYKSTLESDRERIEFLALDGTAARERYLQSKGYTGSASRHARDVASLIEQNDIAMGMPAQAVKESWGDPMSVEYAGRPESGNERWRYIEYVSTQEGYQEEQRVLYFENGRLVGWEKY